MARILAQLFSTLLLLLILSPGIVSAQTSDFSFLSKPLNYAADVVVSGNLAYVAAGEDLIILNISDPARPSQVGSYHAEGCSFLAIDLAGDNSVITQNYFRCPPYNTLYIVDVSDPVAPTRVGDPVNIAPGAGWEVNVSGNYAYIANGPGGLTIVNLTTWEVSTFNPTGLDVQDVKVVGNVAYLADLNRKVWTVDITDKIHPVKLDTLDLPSYASGVAVAGDFAYVSLQAYIGPGNGGLEIVNVADPGNIFAVEGSLIPMPYPDAAWDVEVSGKYAFVVDDYGRIAAFDISNPNTPTLADNYDVVSDGWKLTVSDDLVFSSGGSAGLVILRFKGLSPDTGIQLNVPYFNQTDLPWGTEVYDSADTLNLDCEIYGGPYIRACGCALTSAAMLLKYYGVNFSPEGLPTNPETLNNWLFQHSGYNYGAVKWPSIATFSVQSNLFFGSQKIQFTGFGIGNDFITLKNDLNNKQPVILQEPGHFVIAKGIQENTYFINDPRWSNRTTLQAYGNSFLKMTRFEKTNTNLSTLYISAPTPAELFLIDSMGRRAGKDPISGIIYTDIPNSYYVIEPALIDDTFEDTPFPYEGKGINTLAVIQPVQDKFVLNVYGDGNSPEFTISGYDQNGEITVKQFLPGSKGKHQIAYSPEPGSAIGITKNVEIDVRPWSRKNPVWINGNGVVPIAILTSEGFNATSISISNVKAGPGNALPFLKKGIKLDIDKDVDRDLLLFFKIKELGLRETDTQLCLTGNTTDGLSFSGCDKIQIMKIGKQKIDFNEAQMFNSLLR